MSKHEFYRSSPDTDDYDDEEIGLELDPMEAEEYFEILEDEPRWEEEQADTDPMGIGSTPIYSYNLSADPNFATGPIFSNHPIDEYVPLEQAIELDPVFAAMSSEDADPAVVYTDVDIKNRWEIRGTVHTVAGDRLRYRVPTMVFEPGGRLIVHANVGITIIVNDLFIQDKYNPGSIEMVPPDTPAQQPPGANGRAGINAPNYRYRGGDGGMGYYGLQGKPGKGGRYIYIVGTRLDNAYPLELITRGGNGGAGSNGGRGGRGGNGHKGRNGKSNAFDCTRGCTSGTRGGAGGRGGYPHYGGRGGNGGTVWLQGPENEFLKKARVFRIDNYGGKGGLRGRPGSGGSGGSGGKAGNDPGWCGPCYQGRSGPFGASGPIGSVTNGADGNRGKIRHIPT